MKSRFISPSVVICLSVIALLAFLWSVLLDWRYVFGSIILDPISVGLAALGYTAYVGVWIAGLLSASRGSPRGLLTVLVFAVLLVAYAVLDWVAYCPTSCVKWPVYYVANGLNLTTGLLAVVATGSHLRTRPTRAAGEMSGP